MWQESVKFSLNEGGFITASPFSNNPKPKLLQKTPPRNPKQNNREAFLYASKPQSQRHRHCLWERGGCKLRLFRKPTLFAKIDGKPPSSATIHVVPERKGWGGTEAESVSP